MNRWWPLYTLGIPETILILFTLFATGYAFIEDLWFIAIFFAFSFIPSTLMIACDEWRTQKEMRKCP